LQREIDLAKEANAKLEEEALGVIEQYELLEGSLREAQGELAALEQSGVARVSIASGATLTVMSFIKQIAEQLHASRRFDMLTHSMNRPEAQKLFEPRE